MSRHYGKGGWNGRTKGKGKRTVIDGTSQMANKELYRSLYRAPVDMEGQAMSVPIKLEIEIKEDENANQSELNDNVNTIMDLYREEFTSAAQLHGIQIISVDEAQLISEGRKCVSLYQLVCSDWRSALIPFIQKFFIGIKKKPIPSHETPIITTQSLLLYPLRLVDPHFVPISSVKFGSLIDNGHMGIHWIMSGGDLSIMDAENGFTFDKRIEAFLDYDKLLINIQYCNREKDLDHPYEEFDVKGNITIEMISIHRIFFDQKIEYGETKCSLVLLLDAPPKLKVKRDSEEELGFWRNFPWEPREELQRGRYPGEISDKKTMCNSKAVVLEFDRRIREKIGPTNFESLYFDMISRIRHKTGRMIEFSSFGCEDMLEGKVRHSLDGSYGEIKMNKQTELKFPYFIDAIRQDKENIDFFDRTVEEFIRNASEKLVMKKGKMKEDTKEDHIRWKAFSLRALLQGILDRGMEFRIELLRYRSVWYRFVEMVSTSYVLDEHRTLHALERVMNVITEERPTCTIPMLFRREWTASTLEHQIAVFSERDRKDGYWKIMKLVATPTRIIFMGYEVSMGNRMLNKFAKEENHVIRLAFRDESGCKFRNWNYGRKLEKRTKRFLTEGLTYAGRTYHWLGNSNSQLNDQCCYMIDVDFERNKRISIHDIHKQMGKFYDLPNIPKMLARIGQLFTQTKPSEQALSPSEVGDTHELVGGRTSAGKSYTFSDGVGCISGNYAESLSKDQGLVEAASAFQIRYRGEKGMLCVDPLIDKRTELMKMMGKDEEKKVLVRPSMTKFHVEDEESSNLEIVKLSSSSEVVLNRPFINILCQVSASQSVECNNRIRRRVMQLMHSMSKEGIQSLYIEDKAIKTITEMSFPSMLENFVPSSVFQYTTEPFFRSLLLANCKYIIRKQLSKMNIKVPTSKSRSMFGVIDTTGLLQHGQIFCQYSESVGKQVESIPSIGRKIVLTGPALITKNPCVSSGDVRIFEAVDIPALRHLVDVVVFPMHGPRPHPDEMAGSDLDGDEYLIIWDEQFFLERNEEAAVFPVGVDTDKWAIPKKNEYNREKGKFEEVPDLARCDERKADFFAEAIVNGQPGMLCSAHLAISNFYGLDSKVANSLAAKISVTLDYQKSGIQAAPMTTDETPDENTTNHVIPAESSKLKPEFFRNYTKPGYISIGILGEVWREATKYEHALECLDERKREIERDTSLLIPGWEDYKSPIEEELANYSDKMKSVLGRFGIATEEELLSGMIITMSKQFSENEEYNGTFFTTNRAVERKVRRIIEMTREKFFESLIDNDEQLGDGENKWNAEKMKKKMKKASAAYNVAYEAANLSLQRGEQCAILLSFPWIVYEILLDIKMRPNDGIHGDVKMIKQTNIPQKISEFIDGYSEDPSNSERYANFMRRFYKDDSIVSQWMNNNAGLSKASFLLIEWANRVGGIGRGFSEENLIYLFVLFGLGLMRTRGRRIIQSPRNKGEHLLLFLDYISSEEFRNRSFLSFKEVGGGVLMRGEWRKISEPALSCFLSLVTTLRLPIDKDSAATASLREFEPRVMQLPTEVVEYKLGEVRDALRRVSGCQDIRLRSTDYGKTTRTVQVSAIGTSEQLRVLTSFIYPPAPPREDSTLKGKVESLPAFTHSRLMKAAKESSSLL